MSSFKETTCMLPAAKYPVLNHNMTISLYVIATAWSGTIISK